MLDPRWEFNGVQILTFGKMSSLYYLPFNVLFTTKTMTLNKSWIYSWKTDPITQTKKVSSRAN